LPYAHTQRPVAWQDQSHEPKTHRALPIAPPRPSFTPRSHQHNATTAPTYGSESSVTGRTDVGVMLASSPTATLFTTADVALQQTPCQKRPTTVSKETYYSVKPSPSCDHSSRPSSSPQAARAGERKTQRPLYFANELPGAAAKVLDRRSEQDAEIATITGEVDRLTNLLQVCVCVCTCVHNSYEFSLIPTYVLYHVFVASRSSLSDVSAFCLKKICLFFDLAHLFFFRKSKGFAPRSLVVVLAFHGFGSPVNCFLFSCSEIGAPQQPCPTSMKVCLRERGRQKKRGWD
jgi:hypothetical protein